MFFRSVFLTLFTVAFAGSAAAQVNADSQDYRLQATKVVGGLDHPWSMAFLPDGRILVTERKGNLRIVEAGKLLPQAVEGMPKATPHGQGGLLDVVLHPKFAENGWIYWSYNGEVNGLHGTELARGKLGGTREAPRMTDVQVLFKMQPKAPTPFHFGSRIVFDQQGYLFLTLGDRGDSPAKGAEQRAQQLGDHGGKSIRLHDDGRVPADNPFVKTAGAQPEIYSYGHRNMQGAALNPDTGRVWTHEHGPQGGDEVNVLMPGANYGWPVITYGANYGSGSKIGEGTAKEGMVQPLLYWVPSIAPSGMAFYSGRLFPKWKGNLFAGALAGQTLVRISLAGEKVVAQERLFTKALGRIRDVREGPDGALYVLTDESNGELLRIAPQK